MRQIKAAIAGILALFAAASAGAQTFPTIPANTVIGRLGVGPGPAQAIPNATLFSANLFDTVLGTTRGSIPYRGASGWTGLAPCTSGYVLKFNGAGADPSCQAVPFPLSIGGTGQTTAAAARASSGLNVESYTGHGDSIYTILSTDRVIGTTAAFTASRTWTLPAANSINPGQEIVVADYFGGVTSVNTLVIARSGSDTINGATSATINAAYGAYRLRSDGVSKWSALISSATSSGSSQGIKTPLDSGAACDGTTDDTTALQTWLDAIKTNAFTGWVPAGKTCIYTGLLSLSSGTTIYAYGATFKQKSSAAGSANSGLVWGPTSQLGGPVDNVNVFGLTMDGNRAGNTNTAGSGAMLYVISTTRTRLRDIRAINGRGDGIYVGGTTAGGGQGRSALVFMDNVEVTGNYRNGMSVVGLDRGMIVGGYFNSNNNTNNDGPQCGIDLEPDAAASANSNISIVGISASSNGGTLSTTGGSGICVFGTIGNTTNLTITDVNSSSNQRYGMDAAASATGANIRLKSIGGTGNGTALVNTANVVDWMPLAISAGANDSGGAGFRYIRIPN